MNYKDSDNAEARRLRENKPGTLDWKKWGPYLSERQWGTVREDYSADGDAWRNLTHDMARSYAYRWGEDGIGGFCDEQQRLCLSLALWNGKDPILKERLFGLTNAEGNHGEDVKELYYYHDATPTNSYLKMLYKYPQGPFPYELLVAENGRRGFGDREFELVDTGVFNENRYFDVEVEYAKADCDDILMRITATNRGLQAAVLYLLPHLVFRNTWSWEANAETPVLKNGGQSCIKAEHNKLGDWFFYYEEPAKPLFTGNETNFRRLYNDANKADHVKDAFHEYLINDDPAAVNPLETGTKACLVTIHDIAPGNQIAIRMRLTQNTESQPFNGFDELVGLRKREADGFYREIQNALDDPDDRLIQRQAFAGMLWSKQFYYYDIPIWLKGDSTQPVPPASRLTGRNSEWTHLNNAEIISMPDKWEYPWYAAWDLAFHCIPLAIIDSEFAKSQLLLLTRVWYIHPNGQIPAYEWNFSDVNPPVHAWAAWRVFQIDRKNNGGKGDRDFLERVFHKLMLNFTWWVNRKDAQGRNVFQGGFLGLDNIGVFDRSAPLPNGGFLSQSDGTSWMAMYSLNMMRMALELALENHVYEDIGTKFFEHFLSIAQAMTNMSGKGIGLWDEQDEFYYDMLNFPDGSTRSLKVRSMVGLIPLFAVETLEPELLAQLPDFNRRLEWLMRNRPQLAGLVSNWEGEGKGKRRLLSLLRGHRMKKLLARMLDSNEFLSDFGIRALSRTHLDKPYIYEGSDCCLTVKYTPAESDSGMFGGNSNWRGPIWMPVNFLLIESLQRFHHYYGDDFKVECPTGSGNYLTIFEVAEELTARLARIFRKNAEGERPVFGNVSLLQKDPDFKDNIFFNEYFDGDTGRGVGASHQTGWTGLIAKLLQPRQKEGQ